MFLKFSAFILLALTSSGAMAQTAEKPGGQMGQLLILGVFVFFLFWMMRSQSKRAKEHKTLIEKLTKGDEVVTSGGLLGRITKVSDSFFAVQLADGVEVFVQKNMIATSVPKGTMTSI